MTIERQRVQRSMLRPRGGGDGAISGIAPGCSSGSVPGSGTISSRFALV